MILPVGHCFAQTVRYFGVWNYIENALEEELTPEAVSERKLGYWGLEFETGGTVKGGTYHGGGGGPWLRVRYVREGKKVYAEILSPDGDYRARKSTNLRDLKPKGLDSG